MKVLAIIPARSGSKGIKDKNIKLLNGKPLMAYSIEAAKDSGIFDEIMVSTDSEEYARVASEYGASVPFYRSKETSSDTASSWDAVREVISKYEQMGREFDAFCLLQPTTPLRTGEHIFSAYKAFLDATTAVVSVCETDDSPEKCSTLPSDMSLAGFAKPESNVRRQDIKKYYRVNGAIYFVYTKEFENGEFLYRNGSYAYLMDRASSIDIDDDFDFKMAELIIKEREEK